LAPRSARGNRRDPLAAALAGMAPEHTARRYVSVDIRAAAGCRRAGEYD